MSVKNLITNNKEVMCVNILITNNKGESDVCKNFK